MVRWVGLIALGWLLCTAAPARAVIGATDTVPAATILYPYFEVDLADPNGATTLVSLQNSSATAIMGRWTFWTDLGLPTLVFDTYLTGFDMQTINLRDIFADGNLPVTASDGQDPQDNSNPDDGISNQGPFSQDINFASCGMASAIDPFPYANPLLTGPRLTDLRAAHLGQQADFYFGAGNCGAAPHGDQLVRGYITVDTASSCLNTISGVTHPGIAGYFSGFIGTTQNVMLGDYAFVNPSTDEMQSDVAVHVEADTVLLGTAGTHTFYGGLNSVNAQATDAREPLASTWAASFQGGRSELVVWRDPSRDRVPFACGNNLNAFEMSQNQIVGFDMESNGAPIVDETPFPFRTGVTRIGPDLDLAPKSGWAYLNLNTFVSGQKFFNAPGPNPNAKQSWVTVRRQSAGWSAVPLGSVVAGSDEILIPNP